MRTLWSARPRSTSYALLLFAALMCSFSLPAMAASIDFESGTEAATINTAEPGIQFTTTQGQDWIYGDWRANYNGPYPNGSYYSFGNFFAWLGPNQGLGRIDFDIDVAQRVSARYSSFSTVKLEGFDAAGNLIAEDSGGGNLDTGVMGTLEINEPGIAYVFVHDSGNYWLIDNLEFELAEVELLEVDLQEDANEAQHRTDEYGPVVFRRAQEFMVNVVLTPAYDPDYYDLNLVFKDSSGTKHTAIAGSEMAAEDWVVEVSEPEDSSWLPIYSFDDYVVVPVKVFAPYDLPLDKFEIIARLQRSSGTGTPEEFAAADPVYFIFNPWSGMDDDVHSASMSDGEREAFVLEERGVIFIDVNARPGLWGFDQFEDVVFETTFEKLLMLPESSRATAWAVSRHLSDIANFMGTNNDPNGGILIGRWPEDNTYPGGREPWYWQNSSAIFAQYDLGGPVRYGQCWVFGGILTSMSRALGIPSRVITNIGSAHEKQPYDGILRFYQGYNPDDLPSDSLWNFHVWNEAFVSRPDRSTYSSIAWQAYDGTPQELSDGVFQTGPAPVAAVKPNAGGSYDVQFVHTEVQAEVEYWEYNSFLGFFGEYERMRTEEHRSEQMPTTDENGNKLERLNDYCLDCPTGAFSHDALESFSTAIGGLVSRSLDFLFPSAHAAGMPGLHEVEIFSTEPATPGGRVSGNVVITNTGQSDDVVNVAVYLRALSSNGQTLEEWDQARHRDVAISGGGSETLSFDFRVPSSTRAMPGFDGFSVHAAVFGQEGNGSGSFIGVIAGADLSLSAPEPDVDGRTTVTAAITNLMLTDMIGVNLTLEPGDSVLVSDPLTVGIGDLAEGQFAEVQWDVDIPVGEHYLTIGASADGLATIYQTLELARVGIPELRVLLDYDPLIIGGTQTDVTVSILNRGGEPVQNIDMTFSAAQGLGGGSATWQIAELVPAASEEYLLAVTGDELGTHGISATASASYNGNPLSAFSTGVISVQTAAIVASAVFNPESLSGDQPGEATLTITTNAASAVDVELSSTASSADSRYSIYDGNERILAQPIAVPLAGKTLSLRLEEPTGAGWIRVTATPTENPAGTFTAELEIVGDDPLVVVDDRISLSYGATRYDRRSRSFTVPVTLQNTQDDALYGPVRIVISNIQPTEAGILGIDGTNPDGRPYIEVLGEGQVWNVGETLPTTIVNVQNPVRERISLTTQVLAREQSND